VITLGQTISDNNSQMIALFELTFPVNEASFRKQDLLKLLKLIIIIIIIIIIHDLIRWRPLYLSVENVKANKQFRYQTNNR
jgi:hypothetical protein